MYIMNILDVWKNKILFGYYVHPLFVGAGWEDAGFSVRLFPNGTVIYQTYSLSEKFEPTIKCSGRATVSENTINQIKRILAGYAKDISALPEFTDNGSCDGSFYDFVFGGKLVSTLNIRRTDLTKEMLSDPGYYERYRFAMADENTVLDIFTRITDAMKQDGVELYLYHLTVDGEKIK